MSRSSKEKASTVKTSDEEESALNLEGFELIINDDGSVTFVDFPPEMLEIAAALNPDDPLVCERKALCAQSEDLERKSTKTRSAGLDDTGAAEPIDA